MAVIQNRSTEIGDVLFIKTDIPIIGLILLQSFVDVTIGETGTRLFIRRFRYSIDGITYSSWLSLTDENVSNIVIEPSDTFYAEYSYERAGSDSTGELQFTSVTLNGEYSQPVDGPAYEASNFSEYFDLNNICSIAWSVNVLEKLYKKGILPKYIERNFSSSNNVDKDFIDSWRAITHYFALFVCLARKFQLYYQDSTLLLEYLVQRGYLICTDVEYSDLLTLMSNYYDEVRQRGTRQVFLPKGYEFSNNTKSVDGEYLSMICFDDLDEFLFNLNQNKHIGWNIGNSSPLYKGLEDRLNVNKYYCDFIDDLVSVQDLSIDVDSLPYVSIVRDHDLEDESTSVSESGSGSDSTDSYARVIKISAPSNGDTVGLGKGDKRIIINPNLDYEVTFFIKQDGGTGATPTVPASINYSTAGWTGGSGSFRVSVSFSFSVIGVGNNNFVSTLNSTITACFNSIVSQINTLVGSTVSSYIGTTFSMINTAAVGAAGNGATATFYTPSGLNPPTIDDPNDVFAGGITGSGSSNPPVIIFGVDCWDKDDNIVRPIHIVSGSLQNNFLEEELLNQSDRYYFVRGILFNKNHYKEYDSTKEYKVEAVVFEDNGSGNDYYRAKRVVPVNTLPSDNLDYWTLLTGDEYSYFFPTNLKLGQNLLLRDDIVKIDPFILYFNDNNSPNNLYIYNIRVQPLSTEYSKGFIQITNMLELWSTNNNLALSETNINDNTKKYLIPMNTFLKNNFTPSEINT